MTELDFLIELLLNHKLVKSTKDVIQQRIKQVQHTYPSPSPLHSNPAPQPKNLYGQSPSTAAILAKNPDLIPPSPLPTPPPTPPEPVAVIAQTPATQQALAQRSAAIAQALSGAPEKGRTSPRKF